MFVLCVWLLHLHDDVCFVHSLGLFYILEHLHGFSVSAPIRQNAHGRFLFIFPRSNAPGRSHGKQLYYIMLCVSLMVFSETLKCNKMSTSESYKVAGIHRCLHLFTYSFILGFDIIQMVTGLEGSIMECHPEGSLLPKAAGRGQQ